MLKIDRHQLLGGRYDTEMLRLLANNANQTKLPALISSKATIYNKTGEFPDYGVQNDAAIVKKKVSNHLWPLCYPKVVGKTNKLKP